VRQDLLRRGVHLRGLATTLSLCWWLCLTGCKSNGRPSADLGVPDLGGSPDLSMMAADLAPTPGDLALRDLASSSDRGFVSTPGLVDCRYGDAGSASCASTPVPEMNLSTESYCCYRGSFSGDPDSATCVVGNLGACESAIPFYCDEAADCSAGLVCCRSSVRELFSCLADCGGQVQLCKTDSECLGGKTCSGVLSGDGLVVGTCR
jgi:hypothetical protein